MRRAPAAEIEHMVLSSVRDHFKQSDPIDDRSLINNHVVRVEVRAQRLAIQFAVAQASHQEPAEYRLANPSSSLSCSAYGAPRRIFVLRFYLTRSSLAGASRRDAGAFSPTGSRSTVVSQ